MQTPHRRDWIAKAKGAYLRASQQETKGKGRKAQPRRDRRVPETNVEGEGKRGTAHAGK